MFHQTLIMWNHLLGAVRWVGGMAFLAFVFGPYGRRLPDEQRADLFQDVGRRFSRIGWALIGILLITGPLNLLQRIPPSVALSLGFLSTAYGQVILAKTLLFMVIILLSAAHDFWIGPLDSRDSRSAAQEKRNPPEVNGGGRLKESVL